MFSWLTNGFNVLERKIFAGAFFDAMAWVDWFAILFVILGIIYGIQNGFLSEIAEIFQMMGVIFIVFHTYPRVELFMQTHMNFFPRRAVSSTAYLFTLVIVWTAAAYLFQFIRKFFHTELARPLRTIGGGILGGIHLIIIFSFLVQSIPLMPLSQPQKALQSGGSYSGKYILDLAPAINKMISNPSVIFQKNRTKGRS